MVSRLFFYHRKTRLERLLSLSHTVLRRCSSPDDTPHPDGVLKNTVRSKVLHYRRRFLYLFFLHVYREVSTLTRSENYLILNNFNSIASRRTLIVSLSSLCVVCSPDLISFLIIVWRDTTLHVQLYSDFTSQLHVPCT